MPFGVETSGIARRLSVKEWCLRIDAADRRLDGLLRSWTPPGWLRVCITTTCRLGDGWIWLLLGLGLVVAGAAGRRLAAVALVTAGLASVAMLLLKGSVRRSRPSGACTLPLFRIPVDRFSFPSGHAVNAFAVGTVLALHRPSLLPELGALAFGIATAQVLTRAHFASDAVAGALLGIAIGALVFLLLK